MNSTAAFWPAQRLSSAAAHPIIRDQERIQQKTDDLGRPAGGPLQRFVSWQGCYCAEEAWTTSAS